MSRKRNVAISRRALLQGVAAGATSILGQPVLFASAAQRDTNPLQIPALLEGTPGPDGKTIELTTRAGKTEFLKGIQTPTLGINGSYLGPTVRCRAGDRLALRVRNDLSEPTTLHWHGLHVPARRDGGPHQVVKPGAVWE